MARPDRFDLTSLAWPSSQSPRLTLRATIAGEEKDDVRGLYQDEPRNQ